MFIILWDGSKEKDTSRMLAVLYNRSLRFMSFLGITSGTCRSVVSFSKSKVHSTIWIPSMEQGWAALTFDMTSKLCRNGKLSSWNPYSGKKTAIIFILIKAIPTYRVLTLSLSLVLIENDSWLSVCFLGPLHMLLKRITRIPAQWFKDHTYNISSCLSVWYFVFCFTS